MSNIFNEFKKNKQLFVSSKSSTSATPIWFYLISDEEGVYLQTKNEKGEIIEPDYLQYTGEVRNVLKNIQQINDKTNYLVDWENPENNIYLHQYPYLISSLINTKKLVSKEGNLISGNNQEVFEVCAELIYENKHITSRIFIKYYDSNIYEFECLNENHTLLTNENKIVETQNIGHYFNKITLFNSTFRENELSKYLSLLYSFLENITVHYQDYSVVFLEEKIVTKPMLVFEKIDADNSLYLRVGQHISGIDSQLLEDYELSNFAQINEMEQTIVVKKIEQLIIQNHIDAVKKLLLKQKKKSANSQIVQDKDLFIIPDNEASAFIYNDLNNLLENYVIIGAEKLKKYKINTIPPKLNVSLGSGLDFFEGNASLSFGEEKFNLFDALNQYQKNKYILLSDGSHALLNEAYVNKLQRFFKKKSNKVQISFFDLPLIEELLEEKTNEKSMKPVRDFYEGFNNLPNTKLILPKSNATLRSYQQYGFKWLKYFYENKFGACLADDMGLGKTLQTITLLQHVYQKESKPSLIVMPKSLLFNWENELKKFAPSLSFYTYYAQNKSIENALNCNLILTTYAMLRNDIEKLQEIDFCYVVLDESQNIKNLNSQASKAVVLLKSQNRLALSGTPVENNLSELYSLFRFLNPAMFGSVENFNSQYLLPIQKNNDSDATADLRKKIYPFILRRLKKDVLTELPDKTEQTLYVEMTDEQARFYEQRRMFYKEAIEQQIASKGINQSQFFVFQALNELRQIACIPESVTDGKIESPKLELLIEQIVDAVSNKHKVLVFANYLDAIDLIGNKLSEQQIDFVTMTGSTKDRQAQVDKFQNNPNCKVFLLTLKTGGSGLNLTAADMVFIYDPWWNKAAENQAIDRAHRMGQTKKVFSYKIITKATIEEKILILQEKKSELFNAIISADSASLKSFSTEDVNYILG